MRVYRITSLLHIDGAFSGEGARLYGGRWNPQGWPLVYAAATRSLALLEALAQDQPLRARYAFIPADVPDNLRVMRVTHEQLPTKWRAAASRQQLQEMGRQWLSGGEAAVLSVPSVILPQEGNFLLNPRHADFKQIRIGAAEILDMGSRLLRGG